MKKLILLLLSGMISLSATSQNVNIPDANFKAYLIGNTAINTNLDTEIQVSEANAYTGSMSCNSMNISDLTGIEAFTQITYLSCYGNTLTALNVSQNTLLTTLMCNANFSIATLDLSANTALTHLECNHNALTSLDLSNNPALTWVYCYSNPLTNLNMANGNNTNITLFNAANTPNLTCIQVDNVAWSTTNWISPSNIDATASFSTNCNYPCIVNIPDANFKTYLVGNTAINTNGDTEIQCSEASTFTGTINCGNLNISNLTGIQEFVNLTELRCSNNQLTTVDVSGMSTLSIFRCGFNNITSINITGLTALDFLDCSDNSALTSVDLSGVPNLTFLQLLNTTVNSLDVSSCPSLSQVYVSGSPVGSLDFSLNVNLTEMEAYDSDLTSLNMANGTNTNIVYFSASGNPNLTCIQVDDAVYSSTNWTDIDPTVSFSENCAGVGIEELSNSEIQLFPNPTSAQITINSKYQLDEILIFDLFGSLVQVENDNTISVENLPVGIYIMYIKTAKSSIRKRFAKE